MSASRGNSRMLDPYTGEMLLQEGSRLHAFFDAVTGWHRWFNVEGENRDVARAITGASNLAALEVSRSIGPTARRGRNCATRRRSGWNADPRMTASSRIGPLSDVTQERRPLPAVHVVTTETELDDAVAGQTIAGLVSLASAIMVWTGLALAWRRLVRPLLSRPAVLRSS